MRLHQPFTYLTCLSLPCLKHLQLALAPHHSSHFAHLSTAFARPCVRSFGPGTDLAAIEGSRSGITSKQLASLSSLFVRRLYDLLYFCFTSFDSDWHHLDLASTTLSKSAPANRLGKSPPLQPRKFPRQEVHQHKCRTLSRGLVREEIMATMDMETTRETTMETTGLMVRRRVTEGSRPRLSRWPLEWAERRTATRRDWAVWRSLS